MYSKSRYLLRAALPLLFTAACSYSLHGQSLIFFDDFSAPESDGRPSLAIWDVYSGADASQFIVVTNENSADYFGVAGQNYLLFRKPVTGTALSLVATNKFLQPSNVITVEFRFFELPAGDGAPTHTDPRFRFGINNPVASNANRTPHDNRFQYGMFSNEANTYPVGEAVEMRIVYNNSLDPISYTSGPALESNSYDVWINGTRTLISHTFGTVPGIGVGTEMTSIGIAGFAANTADFLVESVSVYSGAIPEPSTYAIGSGALALIVAFIRRRRRARFAGNRHSPKSSDCSASIQRDEFSFRRMPEGIRD